jgi:hypothetical protein
MADFSDREKGYERDFERKQELAFKVKARRNHLLGLWAAEQMGLSGDAAAAYARDVADPGQRLHGDKDIVSKIVGDFKAKGVGLDEARVNLELSHFEAQATKQVS